MNIKVDKIFTLPSSGEIYYYSLTNESGASVTLSNLGAGVISIKTPDKDGKIEDIALGYQEPESYLLDGFAMGKTVGRYANRIKGGYFSLKGTDYQLEKNSGNHHLHGGSVGFANRVFKGEVIEDGVRFHLSSPDGDGGYPAALDLIVEYKWSKQNELIISFFAESSGTTILNITNHTYFNLQGASSKSVLDHTLQLFASKYLETDDELIPTGKLLDVGNTPMDFRIFKRIGKEIGADFHPLRTGEGYDSCWVVDDYKLKTLKKVALLKDLKSGRELEVFSTQPGVQVYTGNHLINAARGKDGTHFNNYAGVAIECQGFPDAPNHPEFPSQLLKKGESFHQKIIFRFSVD